jgi:formylglycine-generating enzyme required for sulfatase activity
LSIESSGISSEQRLRRPRPWRACAVAVVTLLASFAAPALGSEQDERRLDDFYFFVKSLNRGWLPLLRELDETISSLGGSGDEALPVRILRDDAYRDRAELLLEGDESGEAEALQRLGLLATEGVRSDTRDYAIEKGAFVWTRRGDRFKGKDNTRAYEAYDEALKLKPDYKPAWDSYVEVGLSEASAQAGQMDFNAALAILDRLAERLRASSRPELSKVTAESSRIRRNTGEVQLTFFDPGGRLSKVRGAKTDFRQATMTFQRQGGPSPPDAPPGAKVRIPTGSYNITVTGQGGDPEVREQKFASVQVTSRGHSIEVPVVIPAGMRNVTLNGKRAFLIDTHELSNQKYNEWARANGGKQTSGPPNHAAAGIPFGDAQRYAAWAGKSLPTLGQWTHAAFGSPGAPSPRFPWGNNRGTAGSHFYTGTSAGPVEACASGATASSKVLNMAGNVWEWLSNGWYIGGGYRDSGTFGGKVQVVGSPEPWTVDYLRDPIPSPSVASGLPPERSRRYVNYPPRDKKQSTLQQVGLRCVIPLE